MKINMGKADRTIRIIIAIALGVCYYNGIISGTLGVISLILAGVFVLTSFIGFCPLYKPLGINTKCSTKK